MRAGITNWGTCPGKTIGTNVVRIKKVLKCKRYRALLLKILQGRVLIVNKVLLVNIFFYIYFWLETAYPDMMNEAIKNFAFG